MNVSRVDGSTGRLDLQRCRHYYLGYFSWEVMKVDSFSFQTSVFTQCSHFVSRRRRFHHEAQLRDRQNMTFLHERQPEYAVQPSDLTASSVLHHNLNSNIEH